ncbi:hypothetical protein F8388_014812 [Cannabis sativa]|uniref:Glycosyltransferase n=1 Tax=Cannabis sativa TaxID=3483 RepID=A0A7J6H174_CANSA|nr:hypothetical protein F8388_014812 [Cannabis sativa]
MDSHQKQLHFLMIPFMAQGHMIPMIDIARMLAKRGAKITIVTTPGNAACFERILARAVETGLSIDLIILDFPSKEVGLPEGCDNLDKLPSLHWASKLFQAASMMQQPAEKRIEELNLRPNCIIGDMVFPWTINIARKFNIPMISFSVTSCLCMLCWRNVYSSNVLENISSETECFVVPGLSKRFEITKAQLPSKRFLDQWMEAEKGSYGIIINTSEELEPAFIDDYKKLRDGKVWCVGPVSLCNRDELDKAQRGKQSSIDEDQCLKWLDLWKTSSVVYVCLGSLCNLVASQLIQLGLGLEASNKPFIWVISGAASASEELEKWLKEYGFEERTKDRGLMIRGWAPQVLILSHPAIGVFLTHCGWNSILEGICAGVPMVTWPLFGDHFYNENLVVNVLNIATTLWVEDSSKWGEEEKVRVMNDKGERVKNVLNEMLDGGEESKERRKRSRKLQKMAEKTVEEDGSSYINMTMFMEEIMKLGSSD